MNSTKCSETETESCPHTCHWGSSCAAGWATAASERHNTWCGLLAESLGRTLFHRKLHPKACLHFCSNSSKALICLSASVTNFLARPGQHIWSKTWGEKATPGYKAGQDWKKITICWEMNPGSTSPEEVWVILAPSHGSISKSFCTVTITVQQTKEYPYLQSRVTQDRGFRVALSPKASG